MILDKCIKTSLYKKGVILIGFKNYSRYLSWAEDASIIFIIFTLAKSFKIINKYGIFHFKDNNTATKRQSNHTSIFGEILIIGQAIYSLKRYNFCNLLLKYIDVH